MKAQGPAHAKLAILKDTVAKSISPSSPEVIQGYEEIFLSQRAQAAGVHLSDCQIISMSSDSTQPDDADYVQTKNYLNESKPEVIICMGGTQDRGLKFLTGKSSTEKYQCSKLDTLPQFVTSKCVPCFDNSRISKEAKMFVLVQKCFDKAVSGLAYEGSWKRKAVNFLLNPDFKTVTEYLNDVIKPAETIAVDIETGRGQINTVGFAPNKHDAIAIGVLPGSYGAQKHFDLWTLLTEILQNASQRKIYQNNPYETMYFSAYGIKVRGTYHDTQWAQKLLWPEFKKGLDNVGRFYTDVPYWKDEGKTVDDEGGRKDWGNIRDWPNHYRYNCLDTTGTFEGYENQTEDLRNRGLFNFFHNYLMRLADPIAEMCCNGLGISEETRAELESFVESKLERITADLNASTEPDYTFIKPGSWKQKLHYLENVRKYKVPKKRNSSGVWAPSTDELSLKKLRLKHPGDDSLVHLVDYAKYRKALGSYLKISYDTDAARVRYLLDGHATETGRFGGYLDPWDNGFNPQTLSGGEAAGKTINVKSMLVPPADEVLLEIDLCKAETWFVAMDGPEPDMIRMLSNNEDIHSYVASMIYNCDVSEVTKPKRQLGKKSGHGGNYLMTPPTFQSTCLKEMNLVLSLQEATQALAGYHRAFPGIKKWQDRIIAEVQRNRMLTNPLGRQRYFYGRCDESMHREACAYRPQSTIPDITNNLMLYLLEMRSRGRFKFRLLLQVHDSLLLQCTRESANDIHAATLELDSWHPKIELAGGTLRIPTECEISALGRDGGSWGHMKEYQGGGAA